MPGNPAPLQPYEQRCAARMPRARLMKCDWEETHLAASLQQDQCIKGLEDVNGGLVDGDHDCAPIPGHILDALHDNGCRARVEPCEGHKKLVLCIEQGEQDSVSPCSRRMRVAVARLSEVRLYNYGYKVDLQCTKSLSQSGDLISLYRF